MSERSKIFREMVEGKRPVEDYIAALKKDVDAERSRPELGYRNRRESLLGRVYLARCNRPKDEEGRTDHP